jgi:hypothetical protein
VLVTGQLHEHSVEAPSLPQLYTPQHRQPQLKALFFLPKKEEKSADWRKCLTASTFQKRIAVSGSFQARMSLGMG